MQIPVSSHSAMAVQAKPEEGISVRLWGNSVRMSEPIQRKEKDVGVSEVQPKNNTGLPENLKAGVENLSGYSLDNVRVHYNSPKPAQIQALAYTQGTQIHVAPGQEKHLPHEAWHVVQQIQGRVKPTMQMKGKPINDEEGLEKEAEEMGLKVNIGETIKEKQDLFAEANQPKQIAQNAKIIQCTVQDLEMWREVLWEEVQKEMVDSVEEIEESINNEDIIDTGGEAPGEYLQNMYEGQDGQGGMDISNEERFRNEERGGINTVGLRKQLDALSDGVRGRTLEIKFAKKLAVEKRYWVQVGAIDGRGGDLSVRAGENWNHEQTYQYKSSRSDQQGLIDTVIKKAAEQLRGEHGERPYKTDTLIIQVEIANAKNFFPGTRRDPARGNERTFTNKFQERLRVINRGNGGGKLKLVDRVVIEYTTPVQLEDGNIVRKIEQKLNGQGELEGAPSTT
ncbi:MAG: DUF4157 domain-containing protein [Moorea sp. SIO3G5]|nr:DUF4157 domain-containing protein [Moorena sp. SIO3G5]